MTRIELLAPAKDLECGLAAINCGADAVYLGATRFGARENAGNSLEDIDALVRHAHRYWARVYVTLNTLLTDAELLDAQRLCYELYDLGIDGLIIQDVGLLERDLPPIPLIASTQMHNATPDRVAFLQQVGFQRAILARELSLTQIRSIRRQTTLELECFIHGALCVSYSGQCYLSYAAGGRSGNRGQCAQPCRKVYSLIDGNQQVVAKERHLLSLHDLNLTDSLRELLDAGVTAFKIEGRLKDRAYLMNVVSHYRAALDAVLAEEDPRKSSSGKSTIDFAPDPHKTFNRGYTTYQVHGRGEAIASPDTPKMVGELLGTVRAVTPRDFILDGDASLHNGDGLAFFDGARTLRGTAVNAVQGQRITPFKMEGIVAGTVLYRNHDHVFLSQLAKSQPHRHLSVSMTLAETPEGFVFSAVDEDGVTASATITAEKVAAQKPEQALETIRKQLGKTGGTEYTCATVTLTLAQSYFLPVATLNTLRRELLERLTTRREAERPVREHELTVNDAPFPERTLSYQGNVLNRHAELFYRRHGVKAIEAAAETGLDLLGRKVMTTKLCLKHQYGLCPKQGKGARLVEPLALLDVENGYYLELAFDCARCEMEVYWGARKR